MKGTSFSLGVGAGLVGLLVGYWLGHGSGAGSISPAGAAPAGAASDDANLRLLEGLRTEIRALTQAWSEQQLAPVRRQKDSGEPTLLEETESRVEVRLRKLEEQLDRLQPLLAARVPAIIEPVAKAQNLVLNSAGRSRQNPSEILHEHFCWPTHQVYTTYGMPDANMRSGSSLLWFYVLEDGGDALRFSFEEGIVTDVGVVSRQYVPIQSSR